MTIRGRLFIASIPALALAACAATGGTGAETASGSPDDTVAITIEQGPCYGFCPVYAATLDASGALRFEGKRNTAAAGVQTASRPAESFPALRQYLAPYKPARGATVHTRETECQPMATDQVSITVTWQAADGTKTVLDHYTGCRAESAIATTEALRQTPEWLGITEWVKRPAPINKAQ